MTADVGQDDWIDLRLTNRSARVHTGFRPSAGRRGVANALDERLDDIEYAGKLLGGQLENEYADVDARVLRERREDVLSHRLHS